MMPTLYRALGPASVSLTVLLGGCASFDGSPQRVVPISVAIAQVGKSKYPIDEALAQFHAKMGSDQISWRNTVISLYLAAADARYAEFRRDLSRQTKITGLGLDLAILGVAGAGSLAGSAANALAATAAGLNGARITISKEVYFEKTLPALLASIDAARLNIRTAIFQHMREGADVYPLEIGFADLGNYESAASLDGAVQNITASESAKVETAQRNFDIIAELPLPEPGTQQIVSIIKRRLKALGDTTPPDRKSLDVVAKLVGTDAPAKSFNDVFEATMIRISEKKGSLAYLNKLVADAKTGGVPLE